MAKFIPSILDPLLTFVPGTGLEEVTSYASKAMRLKIILDRNIRGFEKADRNGGPGSYEHEPTNAHKGMNAANLKSHRQKLSKPEDGFSDSTSSNGYTFETPRKQTTPVTNLADYIALVDFDYVPALHNENRYYSKLILPFVPRELNYGVESSFVGIASFGRNNPIYQFTGSEDTLTFTIDWHSFQENREDVIFNCRWIEALTKGDGYDELPHRVMLVWGQDDKLFKDQLFLVEKAPYTLSQFVRGYKHPKTGEIISTSMLPQQAMQQITLKRITDKNLSTSQIIGNTGKPVSPYDYSYASDYRNA